ncbi:unnamed protein product [Brassicogethes aeneus]|uniref:SH3 domain-containing protein n=1 Tax=Brassicogethes aeneus TaxID=1431903 RepID=A0A9P0FH00_BRAAE|nr:unnamed protein product [Brassicogethes aeneus]
MGQKPSHLGKFKSPFSKILHRSETTRNPNPEQPIKFQYKTKRKPLPNQIKNQNLNNSKVKNTNEIRCGGGEVRISAVERTKSEPYLGPDRIREKHRHKRRSPKIKHWNDDVEQFGYDIPDIESFLTKATLEKPANIPVVLAFPSVLYQTRIGGYQAEISLPLGMVVNAVFKNQHWLYVQTPHAEEGYVSYAACLPLGIIPPPEDTKPAPCWEISTDVFPKPSGNMTDTEKLSSKSDCGGSRCRSRSRHAASACGERSVDRLYLRAAASAKSRGGGVRQTLLVICTDYGGSCNDGLAVSKGEVVFLLNTKIRGWFYVKNKAGDEGFIPAAVAGHGFL